MARDIESIKKQLQEKFQEFILFCDEYKEGKDEQEVSSEIEQVVKRALEHVQKILDESLRLSKKPLCVGREPFYRARQALVLEQFRTFELEEDLDFFLSESCYEDDPHILQLKFQFFHTFYKDTVEWFDWKAFLRSEFSGRLEDDWIQALPHDTYFCFPKKFTQWVSSPEVQDKLKAVQPHSLYEQAEAECRKKVSEQCYQRLSEQLVLSSCGTPFQVERVVKSLSDEARRALEDESTASCALMPTCILTASHVLEVASIIEERIPLIKRLKALQFNDQDIQKVLSVCAGYFLLDSDFEPHTYLATMSTEQLRSFVHAIMMLFYNDDQWLKIEFSAVKPKQNNGIVSPLQHPLVPKKLPKKS
jgi:hypothetical protein